MAYLSKITTFMTWSCVLTTIQWVSHPLRCPLKNWRDHVLRHKQISGLCRCSHTAKESHLLQHQRAGHLQVLLLFCLGPVRRSSKRSRSLHVLRVKSCLFLKKKKKKEKKKKPFWKYNVFHQICFT